MHESEKWKWSRSVVSDSSRPHGLQPTRLLHPWDFPGKSTGGGCHRLLHFFCLDMYISLTGRWKVHLCWLSYFPLLEYKLQGGRDLCFCPVMFMFLKDLEQCLAQSKYSVFFKIFFFWCGPFLKSLLNLLHHYFCFTFCFFGYEACWILDPWPGIKPTPPALECKVLGTGLPGKSHNQCVESSGLIE